MGTEDGKRASRRVMGFLVLCVIFLRPFFTNENRLFRMTKGTPYSRHCLFELQKKSELTSRKLKSSELHF